MRRCEDSGAVTLVLTDEVTLMTAKPLARAHLERGPGVEIDGVRYVAAIRPIGPVNPLSFGFRRLAGRLVLAV